MESSSSVVLATPTTLSTDTLVNSRMTSSLHIPNHNLAPQSSENDSATSNAEVRGPFTFSPFGTNAMLLLPHPLSPNSHPLYHISVSSDCFRPHIYTTTICRGGSDQGSIVAEIKRPLCEHAKHQGTIQIGPKIANIENIHVRKGDCESIQQRYNWHFHEDMSLRWETIHHDGKVVSVQCKVLYGVKNAPVLASFKPIKRRGELQTLEIFPEGLPFMDDIVVSCLVTESKRTTRYDK
ncbi:hypothetical protein K503DRAFT_241149 [Rhizopogon vinicolor AM-OR11-026]|uniref:DUF6593 domain-containing protein n=1 Tax=Rhizopogon vinicolor AM-OR11-026 TaxID=1314800 RepID=A0A1B7NE34_9AGAM|nr:hypothetical protein K503DRAFT_241149 [Rhizopogon vinicolor AM-OR11-026]